jgi:hypothetical protein
MSHSAWAKPQNFHHNRKEMAHLFASLAAQAANSLKIGA